MAVILFERNQGSSGTPTWVNNSTNILHFSGSATVPNTSISTADWNDGTHVAASDGSSTDACGGGPYGSHMPNTKFLTATTVSVNGGGSQTLNDTNVVVGNCPMRIHLDNSGPAVAIQTNNSKFFSFDPTVSETTEAAGVECKVWERAKGVTQTDWFTLNDDSANVGGNNASEFHDLDERTAAIDNFWHLALSARGESAGPKANFDFKVTMDVF